MTERLAKWTKWLNPAGPAALGLAALLASASVGCGAWEPEPEYPQYQYAAPAPARSAELAAEDAARAKEEAEAREVVVGEDETASADEYTDTDPSALTEFKPVLENHGAWVDDSTYGTVWVPASTEVGTDFQPYVTAGHWTYSDSTDYVWVSDCRVMAGRGSRVVATRGRG